MKNDTAHKKHPLVSVITINYNQAELTFAFLESMQKISYPNYEIVVVDNNSPDRMIDETPNRFPEVKYIRSAENLGFAGGNNLGIAHSRGDYFLFINNDTEVDPGFMEPLVERLSSSEKIGMVSPKILFHYAPDTIQYAGYTPFNFITIRNNLVGYRQKDSTDFQEAGRTNLAHGAAMMVRKEAMEKAGLMADIYFLYYEELDWGVRIVRKGFDVWYEPASRVYHKESMSTGKDSPLKVYYMTRNRLLFTRRNVKGFRNLISILYQIGIAIPKNASIYLLARKWKHLSAVLRGFFWHFGHMWDKKIFINPGL